MKHLVSEKCPECDSSVPIPENPLKGEIVTCSDCGLDLQVIVAGESIGIKPLIIEKEDWGE